ncbi:MAG: Alkaline phosphatase synthesis transcriptional regulatory protein PhoP [Bryobacteraceae bacterium]|nr:Alkaline phosphatase synthesis transcriptional regulatory protein PhoP [Bryobacteraceae bacterium]
MAVPAEAIPPRILIVDDDVKFCRLVQDYLEPLGYTVGMAHSGHEGLERALSEPYAAVILDVMLPGINGLEVLRQLRRKSDVPVLMLTARGDEADRIAGLEIGADDYLPKTFSIRELLARLRAVLRRSTMTAEVAAEPSQAPIPLGELWIDPEARAASLGGKSLNLTPIEYQILLTLARAPGRVRTREQLLDAVADRSFDVFDRSIDVHVSSLRKKLGDDVKTPRFIETVRGAGYRMKKPVAEFEA